MDWNKTLTVMKLIDWTPRVVLCNNSSNMRMRLGRKLHSELIVSSCVFTAPATVFESGEGYQWSINNLIEMIFKNLSTLLSLRCTLILCQTNQKSKW